MLLTKHRAHVAVGKSIFLKDSRVRVLPMDHLKSSSCANSIANGWQENFVDFVQRVIKPLAHCLILVSTKSD